MTRRGEGRRTRIRAGQLTVFLLRRDQQAVPSQTHAPVHAQGNRTSGAGGAHGLKELVESMSRRASRSSAPCSPAPCMRSQPGTGSRRPDRSLQPTRQAGVRVARWASRLPEGRRMPSPTRREALLESDRPVRRPGACGLVLSANGAPGTFRGEAGDDGVMRPTDPRPLALQSGAAADLSASLMGL